MRIEEHYQNEPCFNILSLPVFSPDILDITDEQLIAKFHAGVANVAAASLAIGYCTQVMLKPKVSKYHPFLILRFKDLTNCYSKCRKYKWFF